jgi:hypothetical protein
MDDDETKFLSRMSGETEGLLMAPLSGRYQRSTLHCVEQWGTAYRKSGLPFARSKEDAVLLREMAKSGLVVSTGGRTKATAHRLSWAGLVACMTESTTPHDTIVALHLLADMQGDRKAVMGYELCPTAIDWFKGGDVEAYSDELSRVDDTTFPLLAMGWAGLQTDWAGQVWCLFVTDAGRAALKDLPDLTLEAGTHFDFDAWADGLNAASRYATIDPPPSVKHSLCRRLSSSGAWGDVGSMTEAKRRKKLDAAAKRAAKTIAAQMS